MKQRDKLEMDNLDHRESNKNLSLQIYNKWNSNTKFHFTGKDTLLGFEGEVDLVIKQAPLFLKGMLDTSEEILVCQNIKFNQHTFSSNLFERYFVRLISKALEELYRFSIFHQLPGVLILFSQEEIPPLTALQKHWLKDFSDLFILMEFHPKELHQLYMPTDFNGFQNYRILHDLLEKSIHPTQGENK